MTNYEALISLDKGRLAMILDQIYLTGMNVGLRDSDEELDDSPYDESWLSQEAETALVSPDLDDPVMLASLEKAILRSAGLDLE